MQYKQPTKQDILQGIDVVVTIKQVQMEFMKATHCDPEIALYVLKILEFLMC